MTRALFPAEHNAVMARSNLSLPHERRKAQLRGAQLRLRVGIAERREQLQRVSAELKAMRPAKPKQGI